MEFIMTTDLAATLPKSIDFNYEALKKELSERLEHYNALVVTEDTIPDAKTDRANLNKLKEALETRRKEVKKEILVPYTLFESKVKELVGLIDQPILAIDTQLKAYDEKRKEEKQKEVAEAYASIVPEVIQDIIPLEKVMKPQWLNATVKLKKVEEELSDIVKRTKADLMVIDTVDDEYKAAVRETYIKTHDIEKAIAQRDALKTAAEAFRQHEEAKADKESAPSQKAPESVNMSAPEAETAAAKHTLVLEFQITQAQANMLKKFLVENGISHRKI